MPDVFNPMDHFNPAEDRFALGKLARIISSKEGYETAAIEVGAWAGMTTMDLTQYFCRVYAIDNWQGNPGDRIGDLAKAIGPDEAFRTFCRNVGELLFREITPCMGDSLLWASVWPFKVPFLFIDADHRYEAVKADILAWKPHVAPGGVLVVHDYGVDFLPGVTRAVDELLPDRKLIGQSLAYVEIP